MSSMPSAARTSPKRSRIPAPARLTAFQIFRGSRTSGWKSNIEGSAAVDILNSAEARVLGSLMEKQVCTPEYYPLTLNYLVGACNQKTSREPVMDLDEGAVAAALVGL